MCKTVREWLREHVESGFQWFEPVEASMPTLAELQQSERCYEFERLRLNRKIIGAFRYGLLGADGKPQWDRVPDMIRRLKEYQRDSNAEHLLDVANICECEFVEGDHLGVIPQDDGQHTEVKP